MSRISAFGAIAILVISATVEGADSYRELNLRAKRHAAERQMVATRYADMLIAATDTKAPVEIYIALVDLNNDGRSDIVAQFVGSPTCGTAGCSTLALVANSDGDWMEVLNNVNTHAIHVGDSPPNTFRPIWLTGRRGRSKWIFNGTAYECSDLCVQRPPASGRR